MDKRTYLEISKRIKSSIHASHYEYHINDLIQDTIYKLLSKNYSNEDSIKLCKTIAFNLFIDNYRKHQRFKNLFDIEPEKKIYQFEKLEFTIPDKYKRLYILRYKFNMKLREIAEFTGVHISKIKKESLEMNKEIKRLNDL